MSLARPPRARARVRVARGFTLVEVLVALAVTAIVLAAGMQAAGALTDNAARLGDVTAAHWCADNAMTELRLSQQYPGIGESEFGCHQLGQDYRGTLRTSTTPNPDMRRIDAVVRDGQGRALATLSTVLSRF